MALKESIKRLSKTNINYLRFVAFQKLINLIFLYGDIEA